MNNECVREREIDTEMKRNRERGRLRRKAQIQTDNKIEWKTQKSK